MKRKYSKPIVEEYRINTHAMLMTSTTEEPIYTDDPQVPGNALSRENWAVEWE